MFTTLTRFENRIKPDLIKQFDLCSNIPLRIAVKPKAMLNYISRNLSGRTIILIVDKNCLITFSIHLTSFTIKIHWPGIHNLRITKLM